MSKEIETFYDEFSRRFIDDIVGRNERLQRQLEFFSRSIPKETRSVLVLGFGSGEGASFIAARVAEDCRVLGLDISAENLKLAQTLFAHPRIEYRKADILSESIAGTWDVIVLPDVFEHIAREAHTLLQARFSELLTERGRILLTLPSIGKQEALRASGGLQIIDETITLADLETMAKAVGGVVTYFSMISVWETNDYAHAVIERGADRISEIGATDRIPIKGWSARSSWSRAGDFLGNRLRLFDLYRAVRRKRLERMLGRAEFEARGIAGRNN